MESNDDGAKTKLHTKQSSWNYSRRVRQPCWIVTYKAVWLWAEHRNGARGTAPLVVHRSPEANWASVITVNPGKWAAALAEDARVFLQNPKQHQVAMEVIQIFSLVPLHRQVFEEKRDLEGILTSMSASHELAPLH